MKAIVYRRYGPPEVLALEEIERPTLRDGEVLIKVEAASVNPADWHFMRGAPYLVRMIAGLRKPKNPRLGIDVAGRVEAVGRNATEFKAGDEVFGTCRGAFAEYACARESALAIKPANVTFEQAAATPLAAYTALQALRKGRIQSGQSVVINGASGGVGTFAVQIAKSFGAEVTGVCSTRNVEMVRSIGADHVVDYTRDDFTSGEQRYDLMLDCAGSHPLSAYRRILNPKAICVLVGGKDDHFIGPMASALLSGFTKQKFKPFLAKANQADLITIRDLMASGKVTPVIDRRYALSETAEAVRYLEAGHARGKVIIAIA